VELGAMQLSRIGRQRRTLNPLDVTNLPGVELLVKAERDLCSSLRVFPQQYMVIKDTLIKECTLAGGMLRKAAARSLFKIGTVDACFGFFSQRSMPTLPWGRCGNRREQDRTDFRFRRVPRLDQPNGGHRQWWRCCCRRSIGSDGTATRSRRCRRSWPVGDDTTGRTMIG
jgi:hypothetical protein